MNNVIGLVDIHRRVKDFFFFHLDAMPIDAEFKAACKRSPRVQLFVDNLCGQFVEAEKIVLKRGRVFKLSDKNVSDVVADYTKLFVQSVTMEAEQMYETTAKRQLRLTKIQEQKDLEATAAGKPQGDFLKLVESVEDNSEVLDGGNKTTA